MKEVEPGDLVVGKTYFATNLSTDRRPKNLVRNKRYIVTVREKKMLHLVQGSIGQKCL